MRVHQIIATEIILFKQTNYMNSEFPSSKAKKGMNKNETHPGESLFSSVNDNVIEIMETWRVNSTLHHKVPLTWTHPNTKRRNRVMQDTHGTRPSSSGSQTSVMLIELIAISWCKPGILFCSIDSKVLATFINQKIPIRRYSSRFINRALTFSISEIATVLLIACPIAFNTISFAAFS